MRVNFYWKSNVFFNIFHTNPQNQQKQPQPPLQTPAAAASLQVVGASCCNSEPVVPIQPRRWRHRRTSAADVRSPRYPWRYSPADRHQGRGGGGGCREEQNARFGSSRRILVDEKWQHVTTVMLRWSVGLPLKSRKGLNKCCKIKHCSCN